MNVDSAELPPGWETAPTGRYSDGWAHQHASDGRYWVHIWGSQCDKGNGPGALAVNRLSKSAPVPTPDGSLLPDPGRAEGGFGMRLAFARWRYGVWDNRERQARAALQAAIDVNGEGDMWWERELTFAAAKRAKWKHKTDRLTP